MKNSFENKSVLLNLKWVCLVTLVVVLTSCQFKSTDIIIKDIRCEYRTNPLGIDNTSPRLSWKLSEDNQIRGQKQTAYQILVASSLEI